MHYHGGTVAHDPTPSDPLAPFRIKRCLKCDYDFTGLPPDHACPECGEAYTRDMLALVGWTQAGYVPGTGMWWVHCAAYVFVWLIGLLVVAVVYVAASNAYPMAALLAPLAYLGITIFLFWERRQQVRAGGNLRLLVTDEFVVRFESQQHRLFQRVSFRRTQHVGRPGVVWRGDPSRAPQEALGSCLGVAFERRLLALVRHRRFPAHRPALSRGRSPGTRSRFAPAHR